MTEWVVTSSALILVVIVLRGLLKQRLRPMVRYALWGLVLVRLLIPFSFAASPISVENVTQGVKQEASTAVTQYEAKYDQVIQQYEQMGITVPPAQAREEARQQVYTDTYASIADRYAQSGVSVTEQQLQQEARQQAQSVSFLALLSDSLPLIWYAGMALIALTLLGSNGWFAWNLNRSSTPLSQPGFPLRVFETNYTATPCLFGLVKPAVYLTPEAARDPGMRRHVLAHELTHYRHGDHIWSVLRGVCLILHWYNPLVWAAALLSKQDAELACDEATIRALGEAERTAYGKTLIGMTCIRHDPKSFLVTATTMTGSKKSLKERITAIARKPQNALYAVIACVLVASIAVGCTFTGAGTNLTRDEAWEKVLAAVEDYNSRDHYHITVEVSYDFSDDTPDGSLTNEFYQAYGNEFCRTTAGNTEERVLRYKGTLFVSAHDSNAVLDWVIMGENHFLVDHSFEIPDEENLVLSWKNEGSQLVVVCDYSYQEPDEYAHMDPTVTFWLNADGSLAKYELHYGVDEDNGPDYIVTQSLTVHTDDAAGVNRKIEEVYNEAAAALDLGETAPTTEPTTQPTQPVTELPTIPTEVLPLPENYTLADVVTAYEENLSWKCGLGHSHDTPFSIPVIQPFSQDAIFIQDMIYAEWLPWLDEQRTMSQEHKTDPGWDYIRYEAALNGDLLSIVIDVLWTNSGAHDYRVYNLDLTTGELLTAADMANRFLHISYPEFLMAVSEYRMDELQATQPNSDMREYMAEFAPDVAEMDQATLYLDKDGNICLRYDSLDIGGAMFYPTVKPFSLEQVDWDPPSLEEAYQWFFGIEIPNNFWFENNISDYWAMIQNAYKANPVEFQSQLSRVDAGTQQRINDLLARENPDPYAK